MAAYAGVLACYGIAVCSILYLSQAEIELAAQNKELIAAGLAAGEKALAEQEKKKNEEEAKNADIEAKDEATKKKEQLGEPLLPKEE